MRLWIFLSGLLLCCCSMALAAPMPYEAKPWQFMPQTPVWEDDESRAERYPDWDDSVVHSIGYREQQTYYHGSRALVTTRVERDAYITVLHYSSDGNCYIVIPMARIAPKQQVSYSVELPQGQQGITRVVFWRQAQGRVLVDALAAQLEGDSRISSVMYQAWYPRTDRQEAGLPYEQAQYRVYENPPSFAMTDIPAARAQLNTENFTYAKDCFVSFKGRRSVGSDEWGRRGQWVLSWGEPLVLEVYLPEKASFTDAVLRLYLDQSSLYSEADDENLQIRVNGLDMQTSLLSGSISVQTKHVDYEMGQYMYPGLNVIELRMDAFSTRDWLLQTAEVWIR